MVTESLPSVRNAANALISSLGMLQSFYLGILTFGDSLPTTLVWWEKALFISPLVLWLLSLYFCILVVMTKTLAVFTSSPSDIRDQSTDMLLQKQRQLKWAVACLALGLVAAFALFYWRLEM